MNTKNSQSKVYFSLLVIFFYLLLVLHQNVGAVTMSTFFCILVIFTCVGRRANYSRNVTILLLYSILLSSIAYLKGLFDIPAVVETILAPIGFYLFGQMIVDFYRNDERKLLIFLLLMCFSFGSYYYYWTLSDIINTGQIISANRWLTIGDTTAAATHIGTNISFGFVGLGAFFVVRKDRVRWLFLLVCFLSLITTVHMVNRSGIFISLISLIIVTLTYYRKTKHFTRFVWVFIVLLIGLWLLSLIPSVQDVIMAYLERESGTDESVLTEGGGRTNRWVDGLSMLTTHPFGWNTSANGFNYVHNMWLDVAKIAGWIPFTLLCIITIRIYKSLKRVLKVSHSPLVYVLFGLNICIFLAAFVEPVIGGVFFASYCLLWGILERYYNIIIQNK